MKEFERSTEKPLYTYRRNPEYDRSYLLLKREESDYAPVGDYTVLDMEEPADISEKKVMNLISALNGRGDLIQLGKGTKTRTLFQPLPRNNENEKSKVIFYTLHETGGVSKENAVMTIAEDLHDDR